MVINIKTTWGDRHYVGLSGTEIFASTGKPVCVAKVRQSYVSSVMSQNGWNLLITPCSTEKSPVNFCPLTMKYYMWVWTQANGLFRETIFRPLGGAAPSNFYTIDQCLLAHTSSLNWDGVSPKTFSREKIKIWPKIQHVSAYNCRASGNIPTKLFQATCHVAWVITWDNSWKARPMKFGGQKIRRDFWQLSTLIANISGMDRHIENRKSTG